MWNLQPHLKKVTPFFSATPLENWDPVKAPQTFWKFDRRFTAPPQHNRGGEGVIHTMTLQGEFYIEHETEAFIAPGKPQQIFGSKAKDENFNSLIVLMSPLKCHTGHQILSISWQSKKCLMKIYAENPIYI